MNLVVATEQLAFGLYLITLDPYITGKDTEHDPLTALKWIDVLQF